MPKEIKEEIIEILDQYHINPIGWIEGGVREKLSNQILELFFQEKQKWVEKIEKEIKAMVPWKVEYVKNQTIFIEDILKFLEELKKRANLKEKL